MLLALALVVEIEFLCASWPGGLVRPDPPLMADQGFENGAAWQTLLVPAVAAVMAGMLAVRRRTWTSVLSDAIVRI